jgi:hypothetical protein
LPAHVVALRNVPGTKGLVTLGFVRLGKVWRNAIIEAVQAGGLDPSEFDFDFEDTETRIAHRRSDSYFILGGPWGNWEGSYVVGEAAPWPVHEYIWSNVEERVEQWAANVKQDLETPDLWAQLQREHEILSWAAVEAENTPFTPDEQAEVIKHLDELKEYVKNTHLLAQDQIVALEEGFKELATATSRLGRKDWRLSSWESCSPSSSRASSLRTRYTASFGWPSTASNTSSAGMLVSRPRSYRRLPNPRYAALGCASVRECLLSDLRAWGTARVRDGSIRPRRESRASRARLRRMPSPRPRLRSSSRS